MYQDAVYAWPQPDTLRRSITADLIRFRLMMTMSCQASGLALIIARPDAAFFLLYAIGFVPLSFAFNGNLILHLIIFTFARGTIST